MSDRLALVLDGRFAFCRYYDFVKIAGGMCHLSLFKITVPNDSSQWKITMATKTVHNDIKKLRGPYNACSNPRNYSRFISLLILSSTDCL